MGEHMGIFDRFKKKETVVEEPIVDENLILPDEFVVSVTFGGIEYDVGMEEGIDFDLEHGYFRSVDLKDCIYKMSDIQSYSIVIDENGEFLKLDDVNMFSEVSCFFIKLNTYCHTAKNVIAGFYSEDSEKEMVLMDGVQKAKEFIEFLKKSGIEEY